MSILIKDKNIDKELAAMQSHMQSLGINASKADVIRFLLNINKQGKSSSRRWKKLFN